jgi:hypothetical protein
VFFSLSLFSYTTHPHISFRNSHHETRLTSWGEYIVVYSSKLERRRERETTERKRSTDRVALAKGSISLSFTTTKTPRLYRHTHSAVIPEH